MKVEAARRRIFRGGAILQRPVLVALYWLGEGGEGPMIRKRSVLAASMHNFLSGVGEFFSGVAAFGLEMGASIA